jgi:hypothetical protein
MLDCWMGLGRRLATHRRMTCGVLVAGQGRTLR